MLSTSNEYAIILLAAGKSSRLGQPKQLLVYKGFSLVKRAAITALEVSSRVIVVTGAGHKNIEDELKDLPVVTVFNQGFESGIASSIKSGVLYAQQNFDFLPGIILMVCDQPFITSSIIQQLVEQAIETKKGIVAATYANTLGTPVLLHTKFLDGLLHLDGDMGAKKLILENLDDTSSVPFPQGISDIDMQEDYNALNS